MGIRQSLSIRARALIAVAALLTIALTSSDASSAPAASPALAPLFAELNALASPHYTGGLPSRNRALAERIRAAMLPQFPNIGCPSPAGDQNARVSYTDDLKRAQPPLAGLDPDLAVLLTMLSDSRQEVRDTAAYTIGLLGPSAKGAMPLLAKLFGGSGERKRKGNWTNDAYGKLTCQQIVAADFARVIPDTMLPPREPWSDFLRKSAVLMARLYLDPDIEYPPGMMAYAYQNTAMADHADDVASLLAQILADDKLSVQKHIETAEVLTRVPPKVAKQSLSALLRRTGTSDRWLKFYVAEALFNLRHEAAIPLLAERISGESHWLWERLCEFGTAAQQAERPLLSLLADKTRWPRDVRAAIKVLGCIKSRKAVPAILPMLTFPDWVAQRTIAIALGDIGDRSTAVEHALTELAAKHWSKRVRDAAEDALHRLAGAPPKAPEPVPDKITVSVGGSFAIDHGLPWCDDSGKYSLDGKNWFSVSWSRQAKLPADFPADAVSRGGRREQALRVDDGWIYGADIGEFGGGLWHVSNSKAAAELELRAHTRIVGIVKDKTEILAFGHQIAINGDAGVLFAVSRQSDGRWKSERVAALPSVPWAFATSLDGRLLLTDEANSYAVIDHQIVPLKCEKVRAGSYFTNHPTYYDPD